MTIVRNEQPGGNPPDVPEAVPNPVHAPAPAAPAPSRPREPVRREKEPAKVRLAPASLPGRAFFKNKIVLHIKWVVSQRRDP